MLPEAPVSRLFVKQTFPKDSWEMEKGPTAKEDRKQFKMKYILDKRN